MPYWLQDYLRWVTTGNLGSWFGNALLISPLIVVVLVLWIAARFAFWAFDRRPRESVRCRKCWYDLRGTQSAQCPECGADLSQRNIWKPGHPINGLLLNVLAAWTAAVLAVAGPAAMQFKNACELRIADGASVWLSQPKSGLYTNIAIYPTGNTIGWPWSSLTAEIYVDDWYIEASGQDFWYGILLKSTSIEPYQAKPYFPSLNYAPQERTSDALASIIQQLCKTTDDTTGLHDEAEEVIRFAGEIKQGSILMNRGWAPGEEESEARIMKNLASGKQIASSSFGQVVQYKPLYVTRNAPWSVTWVPLSIATLMWAIGAIVIRQLWVSYSTTSACSCRLS